MGELPLAGVILEALTLVLYRALSRVHDDRQVFCFGAGILGFRFVKKTT